MRGYRFSDLLNVKDCLKKNVAHETTTLRLFKMIKEQEILTRACYNKTKIKLEVARQSFYFWAAKSLNCLSENERKFKLLFFQCNSPTNPIHRIFFHLYPYWCSFPNVFTSICFISLYIFYIDSSGQIFITHFYQTDVFILSKHSL